MEKYFELSRTFLQHYNKPYLRYFLNQKPFSQNLSILTGQRGIGKTTVIIQYLMRCYKDPLSKKILYIPSDHFIMQKDTLYEIAKEFVMMGGELLCFDEIHKYKGWAKELKSINDSFPDLKVISSGSSALEIFKSSHDLSRRAIHYKMYGMSFREYLELSFNLSFESYSFDIILKKHERIARGIIEQLHQINKKIIPEFQKYLKHGYYPYFNAKNIDDEKIYYIKLEQSIHAVIEGDLPSVYPSLTGASINKIKQLLKFISGSVPFKPDMKKIKQYLDIGDERTLKYYLKYLEDAGIITTLHKYGQTLNVMNKPEKIYLNNTNQIYAFKNAESNIGNIRETFFISNVGIIENIFYPDRGDFLVNNSTIEIGGKNKNFTQIKDIKNSYIVLDDIETGINNKIPLWLFGFLY